LKVKWVINFFLISFLLLGCYTGGGGGRPVTPKVIESKISVIKKECTPNEFPDIKKIPVHHLQFGYLKKSKKYVKLVERSGHPNSYIDCFDKSGNLIWSRSEYWPNNSINGIFIDNTKESSRIIYVTHNIGGHKKGHNRLVILNESGNTEQLIRLNTGKYFRKDYYYFSLVTYKENEYIIGSPLDKGLAIFNFNGELITYLKTPRYTTYGVGLELKGENKKSLLAIFAEQQATSHSSTLFILNNNWEVVYKEYLPGGEWIAIAEYPSGDDLILSPEKRCCADGNFKYIGGHWKYSFFEN
jgi:hypothetical protein